MRYWIVKMARDDSDPSSWLRKGARSSDGSNHRLTKQRPDPQDRFFYWQTAGTPQLIGLGHVLRMRSTREWRHIADHRADTGQFSAPLTLKELRLVPQLKTQGFLTPYPATFYFLSFEAAQVLYQLCVAGTPIYRGTWADLPQASAQSRKLWSRLKRLRQRTDKSASLRRPVVKDRLQWQARLTRAGQARFRQTLRDSTGGICEVTACSVPDVLDACHIRPHSKGGSYDPGNGILLRTDVHALVDAGLIQIKPKSLIVRCAPELSDTEYWRYHGRILRPRLDGSRPDARALQHYWPASVSN